MRIDSAFGEWVIMNLKNKTAEKLMSMKFDVDANNLYILKILSTCKY